MSDEVLLEHISLSVFPANQRRAAQAPKHLILAYIDSVQEVARTKATTGGKGGIRCRWTEARLLSLLQTARSLRYSSIRFNGENLKHGAKGKTMNSIREALKTDQVLWPAVPHAETLDAWLDTAVALYLKQHGKRNSEDNTGEGDSPDTDDAAPVYENPELNKELSRYARAGMGRQGELEQREDVLDEEEAVRITGEQAVAELPGSSKRKRPPSPVDSARSASRKSKSASQSSDDESLHDNVPTSRARTKMDSRMLGAIKSAAKALAGKVEAEKTNAEVALLHARASHDMQRQMMRIMEQQLNMQMLMFRHMMGGVPPGGMGGMSGMLLGGMGQGGRQEVRKSFPWEEWKVREGREGHLYQAWEVIESIQLKPKVRHALRQFDSAQQRPVAASVSAQDSNLGISNGKFLINPVHQAPRRDRALHFVARFVCFADFGCPWDICRSNSLCILCCFSPHFPRSVAMGVRCASLLLHASYLFLRCPIMSLLLSCIRCALHTCHIAACYVLPIYGVLPAFLGVKFHPHPTPSGARVEGGASAGWYVVSACRVCALSRACACARTRHTCRILACVLVCARPRARPVACFGVLGLSGLSQIRVLFHSYQS